ncbi:MAG: FliA/WhiG family RNA polymerase sigma factor [Anaerolineales bacterium]|nr:FliA/WhiG family RNA polymerase sigma factor [Anaerolineales bacterium]
MTRRPAAPAQDAEQMAQFVATRDPALREALILRYVPLVHFVLNRLGLTPAAGSDYDDLAGYGLLGLIEAVDRYDPVHGTQFSTYATLRIRGRILDQLRARDWLSRSARRRAREAQTAVAALWNQFGRAPQDEEVAAYLHLEVDQLRQSLVDASHVVLSLDALHDDSGEDATLHELLADPNQADPGELAADQDQEAQMLAALHGLSERERQVLSMYYYEELTLKEIGAVLGLSESRVCQLHGRAVLNLRAQLNAPPAEPALLKAADYVPDHA